MSVLNRNFSGCSLAAFAASFVIGVIAAFLRITAVITVSDGFLWTLFSVAVIYLAILIIAPETRRCRCCMDLSTLLIGILGTILFSVILLGIEFVATSIAGAITVGLLLFFFSLTLSAGACYARCLSGCDQQ